MAEVTGGQVQAATPAAVERLAGLRSQKPRSLWSDAWRQFRHHRLALLGVGVLVVIVLATLIGPLVWPIPWNVFDMAQAMQPPSLQHPFGTSDLGYDMLARVLWGGRISIAVGIVAMLVSIFLGTTIGSLAGYFGGLIDSLLMRLTDLFISLPSLPLLLLVTYLFRDRMKAIFGLQLGTFILIVTVIGALNWMPVARLVRASFLSIKQKEFIEAAHCIGVPTLSIIVKHILPNTLSPVIVAATLGVAEAIITESALSFLGLGFPPDIPTWGRLLYDGQNMIEFAPWMVIFPGLAIFLTVLCINYVGDGLRDALDPRRMNV
ncbi:ABC transporter permease [Thermorudis peleae]|uniref:ABC transporter permease n=1 Tax=Thermorudis peleae TaxID=1382356 RepID=UPI0009DE33BB|nr:ABC transporter permease [Thermorudis peleae]